MPETLMASTMTSISNKSKTTVVTSLECINLVQHSISFKIFADWISSQPWCNGKVGMYGKSWGGFNGLQVAFQQPPALAAVISLYSTDDRFNDDIHWKDGCILGNGMLSWASTSEELACSFWSRVEWGHVGVVGAGGPKQSHAQAARPVTCHS